MKKGIYILIILILIGFGAYKFKNNITNENFTEINEVTRENLVFGYNFNGSVVSKKEVLIYSNLEGEVRKINFRLGDEVEKGDILAELDESSLLEVNNSITKARLNLSKVNKKYRDTLELYNIGSVPKSELDDARDNLTITNLEYNELIAKSKDISNKIKSPVSGTIIEFNVEENFKIDPSKPLYKIVDTENLKIVAEVPNSKVNRFKVGDEVAISSQSLIDDTKIIGKIDEIARISTKSEKYNDNVTKVSINLEPNSPLKPGDIVDMEIVFAKLDNILVVNYTDVMIDDNGDKYVYALDKSNRVKKVSVETGINNSIKYEIKSGLSEGDRIINNLDQRYKEGDIIR
ncbi:efflux RND transporter periplasmic adaptor subunit [Streptobacillus felis]|uniref:efflux RND transporter periplasmic adaptor subunit n=1 Tax=Streptobacillus felis TaxID=1384509 RepID=UPI0008303020|nr:efflux RND transporter periplasmic adaptor subunit [Streptobacillus felis]